MNEIQAMRYVAMMWERISGYARHLRISDPDPTVYKLIAAHDLGMYNFKNRCGACEYFLNILPFNPGGCVLCNRAMRWITDIFETIQENHCTLNHDYGMWARTMEPGWAKMIAAKAYRRLREIRNGHDT